MTIAAKIQAACEKYTATSEAAHNVRNLPLAERLATETSARSAADAAKAALMSLLADLGLEQTGYMEPRGQRYAAKRHGEVLITPGRSIASCARYTPAATVAANTKRQAIRARVASDERNY